MFIASIENLFYIYPTRTRYKIEIQPKKRRGK